MRASIRKEHPEYAFGEISRIIGVEVIPQQPKLSCVKNTLIPFNVDASAFLFQAPLYQ